MTILLLAVATLTLAGVLLMRKKRKLLDWACHAHAPNTVVRVGVFIAVFLNVLSLAVDLRGAIEEWSGASLGFPVFDTLLAMPWFGVVLWASGVALVLPATWEVVRATDPVGGTVDETRAIQYLNSWMVATAVALTMLVTTLQAQMFRLVPLWASIAGFILVASAVLIAAFQATYREELLRSSRVLRVRKNRSFLFVMMIALSQPLVTRASLFLLLVPKVTKLVRTWVARLKRTKLKTAEFVASTVEDMASRMQTSDDAVRNLGLGFLIASGVVAFLVWQTAQPPFPSSVASAYAFNQTLGLIYTADIALLVACLTARHPKRVATVLAMALMVGTRVLLPGLVPTLFETPESSLIFPAMTAWLPIRLTFVSLTTWSFGFSWGPVVFLSVCFSWIAYLSWSAEMNAAQPDYSLPTSRAMMLGDEFASRCLGALAMGWGEYLLVRRFQSTVQSATPWWMPTVSRALPDQTAAQIAQYVRLGLWLFIYVPIALGIIVIITLYARGGERSYRQQRRLAESLGGPRGRILSRRCHYRMVGASYALALLAIVLSLIGH